MNIISDYGSIEQTSVLKVIIKNIAIVAHVDHGKTTLVGEVLKEGERRYGSALTADKIESMDSNALEKERGITILSKCASIMWKDEKTGQWYKFNIIDTPGHADFGGEVERILSMADGVILLVDSSEGVMPQTKYVLSKALKQDLQPLVIINKIDRADRREKEVLCEIEDLFLALNATEAQLNFADHILYAVGRDGWAVNDIKKITDKNKNLDPLFDKLINYFEAKKFDEEGDFSMVVSMIDYDKYAGKLLIGRIQTGTIRTNMQISVHNLKSQKVEEGRAVKLFQYLGNRRVVVENAVAGDIIVVSGLDTATVSDTLCTSGKNIVIKTHPIDPPTMSIMVSVVTSDLGKSECEKKTSQVIRERLLNEARSNISIIVKESETSESFEVCGRGELQLGILIENMRREGFGLTISKPQVLFKRDKNDPNILLEPFEEVIVDVPTESAPSVMNELKNRQGELCDSTKSGNNTTRMIYHIPSRLLLGFKQNFVNLTRGFGILNKSFLKYGVKAKAFLGPSRKGALIATEDGVATDYAIVPLQARGSMYIKPGDKVYTGMIVGESSEDKDLDINVVKGKALTNMRAAGKDEALIVIPPKIMTLEEEMTYINDDECIEVTPKSLRMRKKYLEKNTRDSMAKRSNAEENIRILEE